MFSIETYISDLIAGCRNTFDDRLLYVGLQGSYLRDEATESSDIDIMVVIDGLSVADLDSYRNILKSIGYFDKSCGFICGKNDLLNWNPLEICHLLHTTKDYYGTLSELVPSYTREDERNYVKLSLNNLYHELCHRYIHSDRETNIAMLPTTCKSVFFIMQNIYYLESGDFVLTKNELLGKLHGDNKKILEMALSLKSTEDYDLDKVFAALFEWCQKTLEAVSADDI